MVDLGNHFRRDESRHSEWLRQRKWFVKAREDQNKREQNAEKLEEGMIAYAAEVIAATEIQIKQFEVKLNSYDAATVTALMENQKQLDVVNARIEAMLQQAYVMEDGRRVFKTEDGTQVFDESGQEVSSDELDFDLIDDNRPTWGTYQSDTDVRDDLLSERENLNVYQQKLDEAREQVSGGDISQDELEELDAELLEMMPDAVRSNVPDIEPSTKPNLASSFKSSAAEPIEILKSDLSVPSLAQ